MTSSSMDALPDWSVYQRADSPRWLVRFKDLRTGKWRDRRIPADARVTTKRQAEAWAHEWLTQRTREQSQAPETLTLRAYLVNWAKRRQENPKIRASTMANNSGHINNHILPALGDMQLRDVRPPRVRDFVVAIRRKQVAARGPRARRDQAARATLAGYTIRNIHSTLREALDDAVEEGLIASNPARARIVSDELPPAETRAGENVIIHLSTATAERLLTCQHVPEERHVRYVLDFTSGLRDGELSGLLWSDLELAGSIPFVSVSKQKSKKGQDPRLKTRHSLRELPLHPLAVAGLRRWKTGGWVLLVGRHARPNDPVFPDADGRHRRPRSAALLRRDLAAAGCPTTYGGVHPIDFHAIRRSFATWLDENGVKSELIDRMMGHAGRSVRSRHYTSAEKEVMQGAIRTIQLNLGMGKVIPMRRAASGGPPTAENTNGGAAPEAQTVALAANRAAPPQQTTLTTSPKSGSFPPHFTQSATLAQLVEQRFRKP